jgi:hypothetical protein
MAAGHDQACFIWARGWDGHQGGGLQGVTQVRSCRQAAGEDSPILRPTESWQRLKKGVQSFKKPGGLVLSCTTAKLSCCGMCVCMCAALSLSCLSCPVLSCSRGHPGSTTAKLTDCVNMRMCTAALLSVLSCSRGHPGSTRQGAEGGEAVCGEGHLWKGQPDSTPAHSTHQHSTQSTQHNAVQHLHEALASTPKQGTLRGSRSSWYICCWCRRPVLTCFLIGRPEQSCTYVACCAVHVTACRTNRCLPTCTTQTFMLNCTLLCAAACWVYQTGACLPAPQQADHCP